MNLLEGHIEVGASEAAGGNFATSMDTPKGNRRDSSPVRVGASSGALESTAEPLPEEKWLLAEVQGVFAITDPATGEIRPQGVVLRWLVLSGAYVLVFFGFSIFGFDLHMLVHPSGGSYSNLTQNQDAQNSDDPGSAMANLAANATRAAAHIVAAVADHDSDATR